MSDDIRLTPKGKCEWAHILRPNKKFKTDGEYSIRLFLDEEQAKPEIDLIREAMMAKKATEEQVGNAVEGFAKPPFTKDEETGLYRFNFKQGAIGRPKDDNPFDITIDVFDAKKNPWPGDVLIGNGSIVRVAYSFYPWNVAVQGGVGMTLRLKAVQIIDHVIYVSETREYGFIEEEGTNVSNMDLVGASTSDVSNSDVSDNDDIPF